MRQLCDVALWLDGGRQRAFGDTEGVLASYEAHVRAQDPAHAPSAADAAVLHAPAHTPRTAGQPLQGQAGLVSVQVEHLDTAESPPVLQSQDLVVTVVAQAPEGECPSIGIMLEQAHGVGIT